MHQDLAAFARRRTRTTRLRLEGLETRVTPSTTWRVDDDGGKNADFTSIQEAVDAASAGDRILVAPGTYDEQVVISDDKDGLRLVAQGKAGAVVIAPTDLTADPTEAIIHVAGADNVEISGFTISGAAAPAGTTAGADYGVLVSGGGSAEIFQNVITGIRDNPLSGHQEGIGIQFGLTDGAGGLLSTGSGEARQNTIDDYQKGGIVVIGSGSDADISQNTITGVGPTDVIAQNGIQVSNGATADIVQNVVSGNNYTPGGVVAVGILLFQAGPTNVRNNTAFGNNEGILVWQTSDSTIEQNEARDNTLNGIGLFEADGNVVRNNKANNNGQDGINLFDSDDNEVSNNFAFGNGRYGIALEGTSTGNFVVNNKLGNNEEDDLFVGGPGNTLRNNQFRTQGQGGGGHHHGHPHPHPHGQGQGHGG
jgi:parallel beta-helix repeat protein